MRTLEFGLRSRKKGAADHSMVGRPLGAHLLITSRFPRPRRHPRISPAEPGVDVSLPITLHYI